jgi:hypothetical protein
LQQLFDRQHLRRAIVAGTVGSSIEFYDFVLSANAVILIFPRVFFPHSDPLAGTLIAFSTFSAGSSPARSGPPSSATSATGWVASRR